MDVIVNENANLQARLVTETPFIGTYDLITTEYLCLNYTHNILKYFFMAFLGMKKNLNSQSVNLILETCC